MSLTKAIGNYLPVNKIDIFGKDSLVMTSAPYYSQTLVLIMFYFLLWDYPWTLMAMIYVLLPIFDELFTEDTRNPSK